MEACPFPDVLHNDHEQRRVAARKPFLCARDPERVQDLVERAVHLEHRGEHDADDDVTQNGRNIENCTQIRSGVQLFDKRQRQQNGEKIAQDYDRNCKDGRIFKGQQNVVVLEHGDVVFEPDKAGNTGTADRPIRQRNPNTAENRQDKKYRKQDKRGQRQIAGVELMLQTAARPGFFLLLHLLPSPSE